MAAPLAIPDLKAAERFLRLLAPKSNRFTFQTFTDAKEARKQYEAEGRRDPLARVLHGTLADCWPALVELSAAGAGVYVAVNETNLRGRTKADIVSIRTYVVDLDGAPIANISRLGLRPHFVVETSPGKFQVYWRVEGASLDRYKETQKRLATLTGGDPNVCNSSRVMRLPGFLHQKLPHHSFLVDLFAPEHFPDFTDKRFQDELAAAEARLLIPCEMAHGRSLADAMAAGMPSSPDMTQGYPDGQRTRELTKRAGWCLGPKRMSEGETFEACRAWNSCNAPPLPEEKVRSTVASIAKSEARKQNGDLHASDAEPNVKHHASGAVLLPPPSEPMRVARAFVAACCLHNGELALHHWGNAWWTWRTAHWSEVPEHFIRTRLYHFTKNALYPDTKKNLTPWSPTTRKINNVTDALSALVRMSDDLDQPCWLDGRPSHRMVAVRNGLLDINTRELHPQTSLYFCTVSVPFDHDPQAPKPQRWLDFLDELWPQEPEATDALAEWFGYVVSGRTNLQKMLLTVGPTRGGKGVIARILTALIGKPNVCGPTLSSFAGEFGLAPLIGKSLAIISDVRFSGRNNTVVVERLLSISGEDRLTVNRKYRQQIDMKMPTRMHLISNELPRLTDASGAIIGRFIVLILSRSWLGKENHDLETTLRAELPGILNWALDGLARLSRNDGRFTRVPSAEEAITTMRDLASPVAAFVRERCDLGADKEIAVDDLYDAFKSWCESSEYPKSSKAVFGRNLGAACPSVKRKRPRSHTKRCYVYAGIALRSAGQDAKEEELDL